MERFVQSKPRRQATPASAIWEELRDVHLPQLEAFRKGEVSLAIIRRRRVELVLLFRMSKITDNPNGSRQEGDNITVSFGEDDWYQLRQQNACPVDTISIVRDGKPLNGDWELMSLDATGDALPSHEDAGTLEEGICHVGPLTSDQYLLWIERDEIRS